MKNLNIRYFAAFVVIVAVFGIAYFASIDHAPESAPGAIPWKSFDEGATLASQTNKKILVDVYTDWCSWCKKMDSEVYTDDTVIRVLKEHFVAVKLNAESDKPVTFNGKKITESEFARQMGVTGYPTILFLDEHAGPITALPGFSPAPDFAGVLRYVGQDIYKSVPYQDYLTQLSSQR